MSRSAERAAPGDRGEADHAAVCGVANVDVAGAVLQEMDGATASANVRAIKPA